MARSEEIDALLMGHLYGELSESEEAALQEKLAGDPALEAELSSFRRTREAFAQLPVEDPPPAISAQLLHEAAKRAPAKMRARTVEEGPGFWERMRAWFQPLMAHPAAASVAALLLVAGVAGALYMRGVDAPVGPRVASEAPAPTKAAAVERTTATAEPAATPVPDVTTGKPGYFARTDGMDADGEAMQQQLEDNAGPAAADKLSFRDSLGNKEFDARLAEPEQERALHEQEEFAKEQQVFKAAPKKDVARRKNRIGGATPAEDLPLANAVSGADPLIVPEEPEFKPADQIARGGGSAPEGRVATKQPVEAEKAPPPPAVNAWDRGATGGDYSGYDSKNKDSKTVARQAPARNQPAPQAGSSFEGDDDLGIADEEAAPTSSVASTRSSAQKKAETYRVYKDKRADNLARSLQGKLNRALDDKKSPKHKRCQEAARIANDILDRNPEYYYAKVESSMRIKPCQSFVAEEMRSRRAKRARKAAAKQSGQAAQPESMDAAESAE